MIVNNEILVNVIKMCKAACIGGNSYVITRFLIGETGNDACTFNVIGEKGAINFQIKFDIKKEEGDCKGEYTLDGKALDSWLNLAETTHSDIRFVLNDGLLSASSAGGTTINNKIIEEMPKELKADSKDLLSVMGDFDAAEMSKALKIAASHAAPNENSPLLKAVHFIVDFKDSSSSKGNNIRKVNLIGLDAHSIYVESVDASINAWKQFEPYYKANLSKYLEEHSGNIHFGLPVYAAKAFAGILSYVAGGESKVTVCLYKDQISIAVGPTQLTFQLMQVSDELYYLLDVFENKKHDVKIQFDRDELANQLSLLKASSDGLEENKLIGSTEVVDGNKVFVVRNRVGSKVVMKPAAICGDDENVVICFMSYKMIDALRARQAGNVVLEYSNLEEGEQFAYKIYSGTVESCFDSCLTYVIPMLLDECEESEGEV